MIVYSKWILHLSLVQVALMIFDAGVIQRLWRRLNVRKKRRRSLFFAARGHRYASTHRAAFCGCCSHAILKCLVSTHPDPDAMTHAIGSRFSPNGPPRGPKQNSWRHMAHRSLGGKQFEFCSMLQFLSGWIVRPCHVFYY